MYPLHDRKVHTDPEATPFALRVMQHLNDTCQKWAKETNIDFSLYGTPLNPPLISLHAACKSDLASLKVSPIRITLPTATMYMLQKKSMLLIS